MTTDLIIDVDPRNFDDGDDPLSRLAADLRIDLADYPTVTTGSGGKHIYMKKPEGIRLLDTIEAYNGIEFKSEGRQVVAAGSVHPCGGRYRWTSDPLGMSLVDPIAAPSGLVTLATRPERGSGTKTGKWTREDLGVWLNALDVTDFRDQDTWLKLMMGSHDATGGEGRDEWIAWSINDPSFADHEGEIGRRWDSLSSDAASNRITAKTLFKALVDAGRKDLLPPDDGTKLGSSPDSMGDEFVWVVDTERFVRRADCKAFTAQQFRSFNAHNWQEGDILSAIWRDKIPIRKMESMVYFPGEGEFTKGFGEGECYNLWRDRRVVPRQGDVTIFLNHMDYMFPNELEKNYLVDYLALLIQRPAEKINFALLLRGKQGTGKSWIGSLLARMIGERNINRPSNAVVAEKYTDWQEGAQLVIIEELMALGKLEVSNRLKPVITDDYLCIRPMYGKAYSTPNRLNLICFTNHADALPIEAGDRRWLVLFSEAKPETEAYYDRLFAFLDGEGPAAVAYWLRRREISHLKPKGVAPVTAGKEEMRGLSLGEAEQALSDMLEERQAPFDFDLVRLDDVIAALPHRIALQTRGLRNRVLKWLKDEVEAEKHVRYTKSNDARPPIMLWSIFNHCMWRDAGAAARCDAYLRHQNAG